MEEIAPRQELQRSFAATEVKILVETATEIDWRQMCQLTSVNELWSILKSNINRLTETAVPLKSPGRKKTKPWLTKRIKKECY